MTDKKDTSPMIKSRRIKRMIRIEEENNPPSSVFDTCVEYPSYDLPEWFQGLQSIVEDETFTSMEISLGERVKYRITLVGSEEDDEVPVDLVVEQHDRIYSPGYNYQEPGEDQQ